MKYSAKTIEYGLYLLVFLLPWQTRWIIKAGELEYTTYSLYGTDILLILVILMFIAYKFSIFNPPAVGQFSNNFQLFNFQTYLIFGLLAVSFISVFFAVDKPLAIYKFGSLVLGAGLFWLVIKATYDRSKLLWSLLMGMAGQAALAGWQFLTQQTFASKWLGLAWHQASDLGASVIETAGADGVGERWLRAYGGLDHPNMLGGVMAIGILLLIGEIIKHNKFSIFNFQFSNKSQFSIFNFQTVCWIFLVIFSAALFFSFSRAAWLGLAAGLAAMLAGAAMKKNLLAQKNILEAVLISGLVFFILFFQFNNLVMTRLYSNGRLESKSKNERIESLKYAWPIIKKNWLSGAGPGNYVLALKRELNGREDYFYQPAHNAFVLVFSEIGIVGFILFIFLILYILIFNFQLSIFKQFSMSKFSNHSLKIENCKLKIRELVSSKDAMINSGVLVGLIVMLSLDHWLWSLHFGALFFWLVMGLVV